MYNNYKNLYFSENNYSKWKSKIDNKAVKLKRKKF